MTRFKLSEAQLKDLENIEKGIKQPQLIKRIQSIKLRAKGFTNIEAAKILLVSDQTISDWFKIYKTEGLKNLLQWHYKGKISILKSNELEELKQRNFSQPFKTASEAKKYIKEHYGIDFHLHWVQAILRKNFNLHSKKTD
ncbi:MAG: helix-turn-helix domain-containing protein [Bacteroidota bacterium]|nr:helix-turn-helix domain-containing protein [Bacteroidota bacterium]